MALNAGECWQVSQQAFFQARMRFALIKVAIGVLAEAQDTPGHADRVIFARKVISGNFSIETSCLAVWTNPTLQASGNISNEVTSGVNDPEILAAAASLFSALSGADLGA